MVRKICGMLVVAGVVAAAPVVFAADRHECGSTIQEKAAGSTEPEPAQPVNAGNKVCPVSGEKVGSSGMTPAVYEYKGKMYNFCCSACVEEFKKDPEKYVGKVEEELKAVSQKAHGNT